MIELVDQMKRTIRLEETPKRIVSLVPSQTELLYFLGCGDDVVGITKFCIHPDNWFRNKKRVGGTKNVNFDALHALNPDLIIANKEENSQADIEKLIKDYPVYISDILNVEDACQMISDVGLLLAKEKNAQELVERVKQDFSTLPQLFGTVLYFIWSDPYMVVGPNTFIGAILQALGLKNLIDDPEARYIELTSEEISNLNPDRVLLSSEPFPFEEKHKADFKRFYEGRITLVDGELFSWYGSRMKDMKAYFNRLHLD